MNEWFLHYVDNKQIDWRYDDPSGIPYAPVRGSSHPVTRYGNEGRIRRRRRS